MKCDNCQHELSIGDWPYCPHGSIYESAAQRINPILVYQNPATGAFWFPGSNSDPTDCPSPESGFTRRRELTSIRDIEDVERSENRRIRDERGLNLQYERSALDYKTKELREECDSRLRAAGITNSKVRDLFRHYIDQQKERKRAMADRRDPAFHSQVLAFDASNRQGHADERSGWKERKG